MTLTSNLPPAIVFGFASFVGTTAATGHGHNDIRSLANPTLVAAVSMLVGGLFGFVSEIRRERAGHPPPRRRPDFPTASTKRF